MSTSGEKVRSGDAEPFLLEPAGKDYLWGGRRLKDEFSKDIGINPLAETWECSTHPDGLCGVASGIHQGKNLLDVLMEHPEYLGTHPRKNAPEGDSGLPILIKLIDAKCDLSIQVHPSDEYAYEYENGQRGKTEMWYVLDAKKDACIIYGFIHEITRDTLQASIADGSVMKYLRKVPVKKGDVFFVPPGMIHAIGSGVLIAEVQQSSNLTYRLFDFGRTDKKGRKRPLHIEKALDVSLLQGSAEPRQPMRLIRFYRGYATEFLGRCKYFQVERVRLNTERVREMADMGTQGNSFQVLLCVEGCGNLFWGSGKMINFYKGDCVFLPADSVAIKANGKAQLLKVGC